MLHLFELQKHAPLMFSQSQEVHTTVHPLVDEFPIFENAPCGSLAKQLPQRVLGSVGSWNIKQVNRLENSLKKLLNRLIKHYKQIRQTMYFVLLCDQNQRMFIVHARHALKKLEACLLLQPSNVIVIFSWFSSTSIAFTLESYSDGRVSKIR